MVLETLGVRIAGALLPLSESTLRRLIRFGTAGVVATAVFVGATLLLVEGLAADETLAAAIAFPLSVIVSFFGQALAFDSRPHGRGFARFLLVTVSTWLLSVAWMEIATGQGLHYGVALMVTVVTVPILNFLGYHFVVFADQSGRDDASDQHG